MSTSVPSPVLLGPADAERYVRIRRQMLLDSPWAYGASPDTSETVRPEFCARMFADRDQATFAIEGTETADLIAVASIRRSPPGKFAHRARIWGVFVDPAHRGRGFGRTLLLAALERARAWPGVDFVDLGASEGAPAALHLYESVGFAEWGREPDATDVDGRRYDEIHLTMPLRERGEARPRVELRAVVESDLEVFFEHQQDARACHMAAFTAKDPSDRAAFEEHWARILAKDSVLTRTILADGAVAGHLASFGEPAERAVTYWIGREHWGRGIVTRALTLFLGIETARPLYAWAVKDSAGSLRVLEKCGFMLLREERNFANARGEEVEEVVLQLVR